MPNPVAMGRRVFFESWPTSREFCVVSHMFMVQLTIHKFTYKSQKVHLLLIIFPIS
jgi:hypothetical protein